MDQQDFVGASLAGATGVELVVALYDGALRQLHRASRCCTDEDTVSRRIAVKKVIDILMYLQARLRPELGTTQAKALGDFYAAMFTMTLEASHYASTEQFAEVMACIRNVRDAWAIVACDPAANRTLPRELRTAEERRGPVQAVMVAEPASTAALRWSA